MSPAIPIKQRFPGPGVLGVAQPQSQSRRTNNPLESYQSCGAVISPVEFRRGILGSHLRGESPRGKLGVKATMNPPCRRSRCTYESWPRRRQTPRILRIGLSLNPTNPLAFDSAALVVLLRFLPIFPLYSIAGAVNGGGERDCDGPSADAAWGGVGGLPGVLLTRVCVLSVRRPV
jgi:hypothetical protein